MQLGSLKVGINMLRGGSIGYMSSDATQGKNIVNCADMGREIQLSYYSGPNFYNPPTEEYPDGACDKVSDSPPTFALLLLYFYSVFTPFPMHLSAIWPSGRPLGLESNRRRRHRWKPWSDLVLHEDSLELAHRHAAAAVGLPQRQLRLHVRAVVSVRQATLTATRCREREGFTDSS